VKNFDLISFSSTNELASHVAGAWLDEIELAKGAGRTHCVALSGGRIAVPFYSATVEQGKTRKTSFAHVHFFWADERCVPPTDPESNFKAANELLFHPLKISDGQIHRIRGEEPPPTAVKIAEAELREVATRSPNGGPILDLVILGMGEDGHVASLFPGASAEILNSNVPFLVIENSPKPPPKRITLSYSAISAASQVWTMISGPGKKSALDESLQPEGQTPLARVMRNRSWTKIFFSLTDARE